MAGDRSGHRLPVPLPEGGAAFDVGEEEGDGAAGKIGHEPLQTLGWQWSGPIVARGHRSQTRGTSNHHANDPKTLNILVRHRSSSASPLTMRRGRLRSDRAALPAMQFAVAGVG